MEAEPPKTPRKARNQLTGSSDEERDTFEDAQDITPKPRARSPEATRSLTERRPSLKSPASKERKKSDASRTSKSGRDSQTSMAEKLPKDEKLEPARERKQSQSIINPKSLGTLDEVNLAEISIHSATSAKVVTPTTTILSRTSSTQSNSQSSVSTPPVPDKNSIPSLTAQAAAQAANVAGRFKSPFSWLSRNPAAERKPPNTSSPVDQRRSDMDLFGKSADGNDRTSQSSLKDRFKAVRMREEAASTPDTPIDGPGSPVAETVDSPTRQKSGSVSSQTPIINPNLAPGTASGMAEGPRPAADPVDWELWQAVVSEGPAAVYRSSAAEMNRSIAAGIPQAIRGVIWQVLADSKNESMERLYHELVARGSDKERLSNGHAQDNGNGKDKDSIASSASSVHSETSGRDSPSVTVDGFPPSRPPKQRSSKEELAHIQGLEKTIRRDLGARTSYSKYLMSSGLQEGLFGVCKAYALYDEEVGYAQGMNFIAMPLLFNMREEEAFCMFVRIMSKYGMREMFTHDMPGLHLHLYQFERLLEDREPALYCHLNRRGAAPNLYATQWFLTLFAYRFPLQLVQRIYDLILSDGLETSILKFAIVLMQKNKAALLEMNDMSQICHFLKEKLFDLYIDKAPSAGSILESGFFGSAGGVDKEVYKADQLVQDACAVHISVDTLKQYATEWEEKVHAEREREAELESLRSQCGSLATSLRRLEERVEKSDAEHVQMASELVRTKVDNEALMDENESLRGQVEELKRVVAAQTEEVENRLRAEMDEVMKRNIEVHNANRALEDEKAEMEQALVQTKMKHAQINSEHESLRQRWNNVVQLMK